MKTYVIICILLISCTFASASNVIRVPSRYMEKIDKKEYETDWGFFRSSHIGKPFVSDGRSHLNKIEFMYSANHKHFDTYYPGNLGKPYISADFGMNIPIFFYDTKNWSLSYSVPASVHTLIDMFDAITAPILNADYMLGVGTLNYLYRFGSSNRFRNIGFRLSPFTHESSYMGGVLSNYFNNIGLPLTRANVSYEFTDFSIVINDPENSRDTIHSLRVGFNVRLSNRGMGYYEVLNDGGYINFIAKNTERFEVYAQYQYQRSSGFLASKNVLNIFSLEVRNRPVYGYPLTIDNDVMEIKDYRQTTFNAYFGWQYRPDKEWFYSIGAYLHGYAGINPYGQFRNIPMYYSIGFAIVLM